MMCHTDARSRLSPRSALLTAAVLAVTLLPPASVQATVGDGPRAYQLVPTDTNILAAYGLFLDGNSTIDPGVIIKGSDISVDVMLLQYTRSFDLGGNLGAWFAGMPVGSISGSIDLADPLPSIEGSDLGLGDMILGGVIGIVGAPAMNLREFVAYQPGLQVGVLGKVFLPTGAYDPDRVFNMGTNRYAAELGLPITYNIGRSLLDPKLTTIEVLPAITVFSDNNDPFGPADRTGQLPLYTVEAHLTHNLDERFWLSLDALCIYGGETTTDGNSNDDGQASLGLGASVAMNVSPEFTLKLTYGGTVYKNDYGMEGTGMRLVASFTY
jgi:hypothetical protein